MQNPVNFHSWGRRKMSASSEEKHEVPETYNLLKLNIIVKGIWLGPHESK
jgi:hypothetical protein